MIRRKLFFGLVLGLFAIAGIILWEMAASYAQAQTGRSPFTATVVIKRYDEKGIQAGMEVSLHAVRSDGSEVTVKQMLNDRIIGNKVILDIASKRRILVDPLTDSTITYGLDQSQVDLLTAEAASCADSRATLGHLPILSGPDAQEERMLGYEVVKLTRDNVLPFTNGDSNERYEFWAAPQLNCYPLRQIVTLTSEHGELRNVYEVQSVTLGDPAPSLFGIPDSYTARTPSEMLTEYGRKSGEPVTTSAEALDMLDQVHAQSQ